ncbi:MAG: hypothetical protein EAX91_08800 [Candidatus Lokiarchaeota archaeon]|nr:hypothetical protein [Candidatus Lokiarchaeota archaeon]
MIFNEFHDEMGMMMGLNGNFILFLIIGLIALILTVILILSLMNRSTKRDLTTEISEKSTSIAENDKNGNNVIKFCPECGEKILDSKGSYCPSCGLMLE